MRAAVDFTAGVGNTAAAGIAELRACTTMKASAYFDSPLSKDFEAIMQGQGCGAGKIAGVMALRIEAVACSD